MKDLNIPGTQSTPAIDTDAAAGVLSMRGDSYPRIPSNCSARSSNGSRPTCKAARRR